MTLQRKNTSTADPAPRGNVGDGDRPDRPTSRRAILQRAYGPPAQVLRPDVVDRPTPDAGQVLVEVDSAGVDRGVWHLVVGRPAPLRLVFGLRRPRQPVIGMDVAGTVIAVGPDVTDRRPGDRVFGIAEGSYTTHAIAQASKVVPLPAGCDPIHAGALAISGITGLQAVRDVGKVEAGQRVLVLGASGGVGSYAVQVARHLGAEVTGVCRSEKVAFVEGLGAHHVIAYDVDEAAIVGPYDVVIDCGGHRTLRRLRSILAERGRLVIVGSEPGGKWVCGIDRQARASLWSPFVRQSLGTFVSPENRESLTALAELVEIGAVAVPVDRIMPMDRAVEALELLESAAVCGKLVLVP